jgi:hypothetical protein
MHMNMKTVRFLSLQRCIIVNIKTSIHIICMFTMHSIHINMVIKLATFMVTNHNVHAKEHSMILKVVRLKL